MSLSRFLRLFHLPPLCRPPLWSPSFLRSSSTNEAPRCRNSLGADVIAATAFLERVIVQQRRNGIARERWWAEDGWYGEGWLSLKMAAREGGRGEVSAEGIADPMLKDSPAKRRGKRNNRGGGRTITEGRRCEMSHTARCIVDRRGTEIELAVGKYDWKREGKIEEYFLNKKKLNI